MREASELHYTLRHARDVTGTPCACHSEPPLSRRYRRSSQARVRLQLDGFVPLSRRRERGQRRGRQPSATNHPRNSTQNSVIQRLELFLTWPTIAPWSLAEPSVKICVNLWPKPGPHIILSTVSCHHLLVGKSRFSKTKSNSYLRRPHLALLEKKWVPTIFPRNWPPSDSRRRVYFRLF